MTESHYAEAAAHAAPPGADGVRPLPNGHRLAGFELDSVLGKGGFGIVYRAFDRTLQRAVAIKEYMPAMLASRAGDFTVALRAPRFSQAFDAGRAAFLNEARLLAQFDHPGLVKVLHFWESHGTAYMVMPFYEGQTLAQLQKRGKPMSEAALRRMLASVLGALDVLHRAQCFHRDISLDNILMLPNGNPVLLDFGAARKLIGDMVDETAMMLKPGYAPIEQYTDDPAFRQGPWTDIYALGALAYALMTGELPPAAVVRSIQDQYRPLAGREAAGHDGEHYGERLRAAIDHALALRIEDRPESVGAFAQALDLHEVSPSVFVPAGYDAPARAAGIAADVAAASAQDDATPEAPAPQGETPVAEAAPEPADATATATATSEGDGAETPASVEARPHDGAVPQEQNEAPYEAVRAQANAQPAGEDVSTETVERRESTVSETSHRHFSWRTLRIPVLVLLLILVVGVPVLRFAIHAPPVPRQVAASRSAPPAPPAPASHAPALAQALPGANAPGQSSAQAQQQPGASGLMPAAPALTTDTTVVEVQAGKDKPVNATDATTAAAAVQPAQTNAAAQPPAEAQASPPDTGASEPIVAQAPHSPVRTPASLPPVRVHFQIVPWGEVYVDGVRRGISPPFRTASLAPGTHRIEIRNGTLKPYVRMVTLDAGSAPLEISHTFE